MLELDDSDIDSIPVVELSVDDIKKSVEAKKASKRSAKKPAVRPVYAEEEMPEDAVASDEEPTTEKRKKNKKKSEVYAKKSAHDIFANNEESGLNSVDLNTPLGEDEKFQAPQTYLSPEELRLKEEARYRAERKELKALQVNFFLHKIIMTVHSSKIVEKEQGSRRV